MKKYPLLLVWSPQLGSIAFLWCPWHIPFQRMIVDLARLLLKVFWDGHWCLFQPGRFFRWHEKWSNPHRWVRYGSLHHLSLVRLLWFFLKSTRRGQPGWKGKKREHWRFRTWFRSFFICCPWGFWVLSFKQSGTFSEKTGEILWLNSKFVIETVMPDGTHVVPILDDAMLDWIVEIQHSFFAHGFLANVKFFGVHSRHHVDVLWEADNWGEACFWGIVSGKAGFTHAGAIIEDDRTGFFRVRHFKIIISV
mgnify:CR=1 FL=1